MRRRLPPFASLFCTLILACDPGAGPTASGPEGAGGKADGAPAVEVEAADEPLFAAGLRRQLCDAIGSAHPWSSNAARAAFVGDCDEHQFTLVETATSTLYAHQDDGDAVTMQMKVQVAAGDDTWQTSLTRTLSPEFRLEWAATVDSLPEGDDRDRFITDLAREVGEFFTPEDHLDNFHELASFAALPDDVEQAALGRVEQLTEEMQASGEERAGAFLADVNPHEILREGAVVGYVVQVEYFFDHPLFDGGGTALYLNVLGEVVVEVEWFG